MKVLCYGSNDWAMLAFARTWPGPRHIVDASGVYEDPGLDKIDDLIGLMNSERVVQAVGGPAKTVVFKGLSSHGAVWDPWRDAHRRYFDLLFQRLSAQHVIILAGEREILDLSTEESRRAFGRDEPRIEYVPDAPRQLEAECGASLYFVADPDSIVPPELKRHYAVVMHCDDCRELLGRRLVNVTASLFLPGRAI